MSDFTTDAPLVRSKASAPRREYYAYFAIIFLAALPLAFLTWAAHFLTYIKLPWFSWG